MTTREIYLSFESIKDIVSGKKTLIVESILDGDGEPMGKVGDILVFSKGVRRSIKAVRFYSNLKMVVENEKYEQMFPGMNKRQILSLLQSLFRDMHEKNGVVVYEIEPLLRLVPKETTKK